MKFSSKKSLDLELKNLGLPYWAWVNFMIYWTTWTNYLDYLTGLGFILWCTKASLEKFLGYFGFELILWYIGLRVNTLIKLLDWDWFYYNLAGMLLENSENLLELFYVTSNVLVVDVLIKLCNYDIFFWIEITLFQCFVWKFKEQR